MNNIHSEFIFADNIINEFVKKEDKFQSRFVALYDDMNDFIKKSKLEDKVRISEITLAYMLIDYFEDISRLKNFHGIEHANGIKIVSYISYWFLRRKPIQILKNDKDLVYVNERFIVAYILDFLSGCNDISILGSNKKGLQSFTDLLFYFLKYRVTGANSLELMITSFFAGQIYQEKSQDITSELGSYKVLEK